jgi:hypothetical protein
VLTEQAILATDQNRKRRAMLRTTGIGEGREAGRAMPPAAKGLAE